MVLRSNDRIAVRPFSPADADAFYAAVRASIDSLSYWMPWCTPAYSLQEARAWMAYCEDVWRAGSAFPLGIFDLASGQVLGGTGIHDVNSAYRMGSLGYWVGTRHTGRGVARAAARMAADIGFKELALTRLEIVVLHNAASQHVAQAIGARKECDARNRLYFNGVAEDASVYGLLPADIGNV